ncbi:hypothetical protein HZB03_03690 [Candidatus Woesearchaeota archaeon]|nr:hypothetical protein [Candidatus Woesearchaeota archaeon]
MSPVKKNLSTIVTLLTASFFVDGCVPYNAIRREVMLKDSLPCSVYIYQNPSASAPASEKLAADFVCHKDTMFIAGTAYLDSYGNPSRYKIIGGAISTQLDGDCTKKSDDDKTQEICGILSEVKSLLKK